MPTVCPSGPGHVKEFQKNSPLTAVQELEEQLLPVVVVHTCVLNNKIQSSTGTEPDSKTDYVE